MEGFDQLGLLAELSAAMMGFVAIFLALSHDDGRFSEGDRHFIQGLVVTSAVAIVASLVPTVLATISPPGTLWMNSARVAVILGTLAAALQVRSQLAMHRSSADGDVHWLWHVPPWGFSALAIFPLVAAALGKQDGTQLYVAGIAILIPVSLSCFVAVVFRRFF